MPRLVLYLFLALGTIGASGSAAVAAAAQECAMIAMTDMPNTSGDHDQMDCCTPECALASLGAAIPFRDIEVELFAPAQDAASADRQSALISIVPEALDPPPRTRLT